MPKPEVLSAVLYDSKCADTFLQQANTEQTNRKAGMLWLGIKCLYYGNPWAFYYGIIAVLNYTFIVVLNDGLVTFYHQLI